MGDSVIPFGALHLLLAAEVSHSRFPSRFNLRKAIARRCIHGARSSGCLGAAFASLTQGRGILTSTYPIDFAMSKQMDSRAVCFRRRSKNAQGSSLSCSGVGSSLAPGRSRPQHSAFQRTLHPTPPRRAPEPLVSQVRVRRLFEPEEDER